MTQALYAHMNNKKKKVLDLVLWHPVIVVVLGILGYVGWVLPLSLDSLVCVWSELEDFCLAFLGLMGCLLQAGTLKWSHQKPGL
jgi:protein-S-isoprenylcysteine O-methyltransferase Ste14